MSDFLNALPAAATNPLAFVAYLVTILAWFAISQQTRRLKIIMNQLNEVPARDRRSVLENELGIKLPDTLTPEQWLRARRQTYVFFFLIILVIAIVAVVAIAIFIIPKSPSVNVSFDANSIYAVGEISNIGDAGIVKVKNIRLETSARSCPYRLPSIPGAPIIEYRYQQILQQGQHTYRLDDRDFKYGPGDIDRFYVEFYYDALGLYSVNVAFEYQFVGIDSYNEWNSYKSKSICVPMCFDDSLPEPTATRIGNFPGKCTGLPAAVFAYIQDLTQDPPRGMSHNEVVIFINKNYDCDAIRTEYIQAIIADRVKSNPSFRDTGEVAANIPACPSLVLDDNIQEF